MNRTVRDPLHGAIHLSDEEIRIIDHRLFRRLHKIRQNGLLYLVFPSAHHTRFEHSLGTLHNANSIFNSLLFNSSVADTKPTCAIYDNPQNGKAFDLNNIDETLLKKALRLLRFSALVHDLGHGPLSHTFDSFSPFREKVIEIIEQDSKYLELKKLIPLLKKNRKERIEHEEMSCILFSVIWHEIKDDTDSEEIPFLVASILLNHELGKEHSNLAPFISLLNNIVASAPVDADRMDYIERDSKSIGVSYGMFDRERLLKSFLPYATTSSNGNLNYRLGIKKSGVRAVENFIQARFELFVQVYYHKTNRAIELMLSEIATNAKDKQINIFKLNSVDDLCNAYLDLSDESFLNILNGNNEIINENSITKIARSISTRNLWKRIFEEKKKTTDDVYDELSKQFSDYDLIVRTIEAKATKGLENGAQLLIRGEDGKYQTYGNADWFNYSPMMEALANEEEGITRIYLKSNDKDASKKLRVEARKIDFNLKAKANEIN